MVSERCGRNGRKARIVAVLVVLLLAPVLLVPALSGCGDNAVEFYVGQANEILADINTKAGELKKLWSMPVSELGKSQEVLAAYRKALSSAQEKLDKNDAPKSCLRLDDLLRQAVDRGRELADITSPFADYSEYIAPIAGTMNEIVTSLQSLQTTSNQPAGLAGLKDKCDRLETEIRTIVPPGTFQGIHDELLAFTNMVSVAIDSAMGGAMPKPQVVPPEEQEARDGEDRTSARVDEEQERSDQAISSLTDIPQLWQSFNGKLTALMEVARQVTGLKVKNYEVENTIGQALEEIKRLQTQ